MFSDNAKALWIAVSSLILSFVAFVVGVALAGTTHSAVRLNEKCCYMYECACVRACMCMCVRLRAKYMFV